MRNTLGERRFSQSRVTPTKQLLSGRLTPVSPGGALPGGFRTSNDNLIDIEGNNREETCMYVIYDVLVDLTFFMLLQVIHKHSVVVIRCRTNLLEMLLRLYACQHVKIAVRNALTACGQLVFA